MPNDLHVGSTNKSFQSIATELGLVRIAELDRSIRTRAIRCESVPRKYAEDDRNEGTHFRRLMRSGTQ